MLALLADHGSHHLTPWIIQGFAIRDFWESLHEGVNSVRRA
jgi:hypothetical protein